MTLLQALLLPILLGFVLVSLFWGRNQGIPESFLLKTSLSVGLGFGLTSVLFFAWILIAGHFGIGFILLESGLLLLLTGAFFLTRPRAERFRFLRSDITPGTTGPRWFFLLSFYGILALSILAFLYLSLNRPHGGWDAWAMWNMRARFIFRGGDHWRDIFSVLGELHPDYPFLVPGVVARAWSYIGNDSVAIPVVASFGYMLATIILLFSSLNHLRGGSQGYVAGIALLGASGFLIRGASQYADVYVGFFFLAAIVLASLSSEEERGNRGLAVLAGTAAALAAWTKNEGIVFLFLFVATGMLVSAVIDGTKAGLRRLAFLLAGALPVGLLVIYYKLGLAPPSDLVTGQQGGALIARLLDPSRYATVAKAFLEVCLWKFYLPIWLVYLLLLGLDRGRTRGKGFLASLVTLLGMFFIFFMVYVTTPHPLQWHLADSLDRVLLQLWPSFLFTFFLAARTPEFLLAAGQSIAAKGMPAGVRPGKKRNPKKGKDLPMRGEGRAK